MSSSSSSSSLFPSVSASDFVSHLTRQSSCSSFSSASLDGFDVEFEVLNQLESTFFQSSPPAHLFDPASHVSNQRKNRYMNVLPFASSRVRLREVENGSSDYINASYINSSCLHSSSFDRFDYIATQAPTVSAFAEFYQMLVEQKVQIVLMLTKEREKDRHETVYVKADAYWPMNNSHQIHGKWRVENVGEEIQSNDLIIRKLRINKLSNLDDSQVVYQFHYTGWPDHGVPNQGTFHSFVDFIQAYRSKRAECFNQWNNKTQNEKEMKTPPIVVHCSAGIGWSHCSLDSSNFLS
jgi:protein tyrosine phosphatase